MVNDRSPVDLPVINTYSLGKFEFCPRAGLIAFEMNAPEEEDELPRTPRLGYLPNFEITNVIKAKNKVDDQIIRVFLALGVFLAIIILVDTFSSRSLAILLSIATLPLLRLLYLLGGDYWELKRQLEQVAQAKSQTLGNPARGIREVSWWGLMKSGEYSAMPPRSPYFDRQRALAGKPSQIITHRASRIPVILHGQKLEEPKPYHMVRLGAHRLLIQESEDIEDVPWGIILNRETMTGLAVPLQDKHSQIAERRLSEFRRMLENLTRGEQPKEPEGRHCEACPYGRPRVDYDDESVHELGGRKLQPFSRCGVDGHSYHSLCGDRFQWTPPHARAVEKELL